MTNLAMYGVPTAEEELATPSARASHPPARIPVDQVKKVLADRNVSTGGDRVAEIDEQLFVRVPPSELSDDTLKKHFGDNLPVVRTVEDELKRLAGKLVADIKDAAESTMPADDAAKRTLAEKLLLPLAHDIYQAKDLDKRLKEAQGPGLKDLYLEAAQRRMAFDFLLPIEMFRPGDPKMSFLEKFGDPKALPLDTVMKRVGDRVAKVMDEKFDTSLTLGDGFKDQDRESIEKRLMASYTMLSLAFLKKPNGELLDPKMLDRIPLVVGQYDAAEAANRFPARIKAMNERILDNIRIDREGFASGKDNLRGAGFIDRYEDLLQQIRFTKLDIQKAERRLKDLTEDKDRLQKLLAERTMQRQKILDAIATERAISAKMNREVQLLEKELFEFQSRLSTAEAELSKLDADIRAAYRLKGGK
jgi:hypothetical protein